MHFPSLVTALLFTTAALATPYPWAQPQSGVLTSAKGSQKPNRTHKHHHHKEPTPILKQACKCNMPVIPNNLLNANEKCLMKYAAQMGCYMSSKGGCPSPPAAVSVLFKKP